MRPRMTVMRRFPRAEAAVVLAAAVGIAYFAFRLIVLAKRRLLWRVRRKLMISMMRASGVTTALMELNWSSLKPPGCLVVQLEA